MRTYFWTGSLVIVLGVPFAVACGSSDSTPLASGDDASNGSPDGSPRSDVTMGDDGSRGGPDASPPDAGDGFVPPNACVQAGGACGCTCSAGYHLATALSPSCPQPCPTCGACGGNCCLPNANDSGSDGDSFGGAPADAGPIACGSTSCGADQLCVQPCSGTAPQPPPHCAPWPTACTGSVTCACLPADICGGAGMCSNSISVQGRNVVCFGCA
jgi:hypothetical protein